MTKKQVLGKGMAALLRAPETYQEKDLVKKTALNDAARESRQADLIPIEQIQINKGQPRKIFKEREIAELSDSIKENGIIQPLIVTERDEKILLIAGERRLRAAKLAGLERVPVVFKRTTDKDVLVMGIIENVQRENLNCVEEALAYYQLMEEFKLTQEEVAKKIGKERSSVANFLRILKLPRAVIQLLQADKLSFGHAKVLVSVKDSQSATDFAQQAVDKQLSVRDLENLIKKPKSRSGIDQAETQVDFFQEKLDDFRQQLERRTGFHFALKSSGKGKGKIEMKFNNEAEFNDLFEFLMRS